MIISSTDIHAAVRGRERTMRAPQAEALRVARERELMAKLSDDPEKLRALGLGGTACMPVAGGQPTSTWTPASITSVSKYFWLRADLGITLATGVSAWADQFGLHNATQATGGSQPTVNASAIDGRPALTFDGTDDSLTFPVLNFPATSSSAAIWFWTIFRWRTWHAGGENANQGVWGAGATGSSSRMHFYASLQSTPGRFGIRNATAIALASATTQDSWYRARANYQDSSAGYLRVGALSITGAVGTGDPVGGAFTIGARASSAGYLNVEIAEILCLAGEPSELTQLEAYGAARYPSATF